MLNFIYNPYAGKGRAAKARGIIEEVLKRRDVQYHFWETEGVGGAKKLAAELTERGETEIVVMGGDGTIHEVLNGLRDPSAVDLGIIPCGSGNDFAMSLGLPSAPEAAIETILDNNAKPTDYMECSGIRGINEIGAGIDVEILNRCYKAKFLKGSLNYFVSLLICLIHFSLTSLTLNRDGAKEHKEVMIVGACNGSRIGGGIKICPPADPTDGRMNIVVVENVKKSGLLGALLKLMQGKIVDLKYTTHYLSDHLDVDFDTPVTVQIDGELYDGLPLKVRMIPGGIRVFRA